VGSVRIGDIFLNALAPRDVIAFTTEILLRASEGTLSRWSRLHLQSLAPTNPHWARVVGHGPFSLWVIHKEGLCPSSGDINRLMMMITTEIRRQCPDMAAEFLIAKFGKCEFQRNFWNGILFLLVPKTFTQGDRFLD
jgi:hypothetical protein